MKLKPIFREATKNDAEEIARLHARVYGQHDQLDHLRKEWQSDTDGLAGKFVHVCLTPKTNTIIGVIFSRPEAKNQKQKWTQPQKNRRKIVALFVDPDFQYQPNRIENPRIGQRLLSHALAISDALDAETILSVPNNNNTAKWLYAASGFKVVPQRKISPTTLEMIRPPHPKLH